MAKGAETSTGPTADRLRRGPYARGRAAREQILDAALALFGEAGYRGTSLRDVAQRAGLSHPGLLHHFPRKEALLEAVLQRRDEVDAAQTGLDAARGRAVLDGLVALVARNAGAPGVVELFCVLSAEATAPEHPAHAWFAARYRRTVRLVAAALEEVAADGRLRSGVHPATAARGVVAVMDGLQVQWLLDRGGVDMAADLRAHLDGLLSEPLSPPSR